MNNTVTKESPTINEVIANGRIVTIRDRRDGMKILTLHIKGGKMDIFPKFICKPDTIPVLERYTRHVQVKGHLSTSTMRRRTDNDTGDNNNWISTQFFVADEIIAAPTQIEERFGIKGKFFNPSYITIYLKGTVKRVIEDEGGWLRYVVRVIGGDKSHSIRINMKKIDRQPDIAEGDVICAVCILSTPQKEISGVTRQFEDIIISDIAKVEN